jgi:signal transduction histidine kinase/CheY-like chemotaxis protein/HAMP domain-containing protein
MRLDTRAFTSKVARRAFVLFVGCALVPVSALAVLTFWRVNAELYQQSERRLHQTSKAVAMALYGRLLTADEALGAIAARPGTAARAGASRVWAAAVLVTENGDRRQLVGHMERTPALTPQGLVQLSAGQTALTVEHPGPDSTVLHLSRLVDPEHPQRGILHGTVDPAHLWTIQDQAGLQPDTQVIVLDDSGRVLFSSLDPSLPLPEAVTRAGGKPGTGSFEWRAGPEEYLATRWSLFLRSRFSTPSWTIVLSEPKTEVFAPIAHFERSFILVVLLTIWVILLLSVHQIRKSTIPLEALTEGTRRLAMGDLDTRVAVTTRDEFGDLAGSFNRMAGQLGRQFSALAVRREIGAAFGPARPLDETVQACTELLARHLDLGLVAIWVAGGEGTPLALVASAGPSRSGDEAGTLSSLQAKLERVVRERRPYSANDLSQHPRLGPLPLVQRERLVAFVAHPLVTDERVVGVAAAFASHPLDTLDLSSFEVAAGDVARGIDRRRLEDSLHESEAQTRQLQKMEAMGRLAGGVAHDFNNLLTVITMRSKILLEQLPADHPHRKAIKSIDDTAGRAAVLTRQLLTFSRKQVLAPVVLDLNAVVASLTEMLKRLIGSQVELVVTPGEPVARVMADRGQIEQVIVNLVVNARDAMPDGGRITIGTANVARHEGRDDPEGARPGPHVMLSVTDNGTGMDATTQARIFEPFFTTKAPGKGTGLGLATVYGIVRQSGGAIAVHSALGSGTTFEITLPAVEAAQTTEETSTQAPAGGTETVLVVDDESEVLALVEEALVAQGYQVLAAARPGDALHLAEGHRGPIHLLLSDVVMPEMNGTALARALRALRPEMAVLFMSGYAEDREDEKPDRLEPSTEAEGPLLQKPFTPVTVARAVRTALDTVARPVL